MTQVNKKVLIIGGAGYVGCRLSDALAAKGYDVTVFDLFIYGDDVFESRDINIVKGDLRNLELVKTAIDNQDYVIHLACISNDPSFDLNPLLGKSINLDAFVPILDACESSNVKRFVYASSSSVYGVKSEANVHEKMLLEPLTDYSRFKAQCENLLLNHSSGFEKVIIRPATVCGYSKRQRLDLVVNILTNLAYNKGEITIFGGNQLRPNIHIDDMVRAYILLLESDRSSIHMETFNAGYENMSVDSIADAVKGAVGDHVKVLNVDSNDNRSYHISSRKIYETLGFQTNFTVQDAINDLVNAFKNNKLADPLNNKMFINVKRMQEINLQ